MDGAYEWSEDRVLICFLHPNATLHLTPRSRQINREDHSMRVAASSLSILTGVNTMMQAAYGKRSTPLEE